MTEGLVMVVPRIDDMERQVSTVSSSPGKNRRSESKESYCVRHELDRPESKESFVVSQDQLVNNAASQALVSRTMRSTHWSSTRDSVISDALDTSGGVDWDKPKNMQYLKDVLRLVRRLFWAFEEVDTQVDEQEEPPDEKRKHLRQKAAQIVQNEAFSSFFMMLTFYALFGPDILLAFGHTHTNPDDRTLAIINTFVLVFFVIEELLQIWAFDGYFLSGRFWIDTVATLSIVGDTWMAVEFIQSDALVAGRSSRLVRFVRIGGRSGRLVRLLRVARLTQLLKLIPKLKHWMERSTEDLALFLFHKRLWYVYQFVDSECNGQLSREDLSVFHTAMNLAFPERQAQNSMDRILRFGHDSKTVAKSNAKLHFASMIDRSFKGVVRSFRLMPTGKRAFRRCIADIQCMKESCAIVERAIGRLTLKVCVMVLALLVMMQLLEAADMDISISQGLKQLDLVARDTQVTSDFMCQLVRGTYSEAASASLQLLILQSTTYWDGGSCRHDAPHDVNAEDTAVQVVKDSPNEPHELMIEYLENSQGAITTVAVFDIHSSMRSSAVSSFTHTVVVVLLLMVLVILFASDMKRLSNSNVLHPLWVLLDDMCALKSIELLSEQTQELHAVLYAKEQNSRWKRLLSRCRIRQGIPVAEELLQLRKAFDKLHTAMLSWSKYVPVILLKQLLEAGVEAKIGCAHMEVTVFFCDIVDWGEVVKDMEPKALLNLLGEILSGINAAIVENGGTLLEFIGDEVLAIFNAPMKVPNHSRAAINAALEAKDFAANLPEGRGVNLKFGVHRAKVLCGNLGSPTRMKYGVLGDGVNLTARLKSLNTRYGTQLLVSPEALFVPTEAPEYPSEAGATTLQIVRSRRQRSKNDSSEELVVRNIGNLVLKGRTTPTPTMEVFGKKGYLPERKIRGAETFRRAFDLYLGRNFVEAKALFEEANNLLSGCARDSKVSANGMLAHAGDAPIEDRPSKHHIQMCEQYIHTPPPENWDGSEVMKKKAW